MSVTEPFTYRSVSCMIRQGEKNFRSVMQRWRWQAGLADGRRDLGCLGLIIIAMEITETESKNKNT